jgi:oxygen-dependent protoporphyrinogen oxidase
MSLTHQPSIVVIGAGVAGLAAARRLERAGARVIVLEQSDYAGGRVHTETFDGMHIDTGAQFIANFYTTTLNMIRELGLAGDLVPIRGGAAIWRGMAMHKLWTNWRLVFTHLIPPRSKIRLLRTLPPLLANWTRLDFHAFHKAYQLDTQSVADFAHKRLDSDVLDYVIQPSLAGIFYWTPARTSQALMFMLLKSGIGMKLLTLRQGLAQLPRALASSLDVRYGTEVQSVRSDGSDGYLVQARAGAEQQQFNADGVVCCTPATAVANLFPELTDGQRAFFSVVRYSSSASIALGVDRRLPSDTYGIFYPERELKYLAAINVLSAKNAAQLPAGHDVIQLFSSGAAGSELLENDDDGIRDKLWTDFQQLAPFLVDGNTQLYRVYRWQNALPEFDVGHFRRLKTFADGAIESGRIVFAGDYLGGPFIESAITSGIQAAERMLARFAARMN